MQWTVRAAASGTLTDDQADRLDAPGVIVHYNATNKLIELTFTVNAETATAASASAFAKVDEISDQIGLPPTTQMLVRTREHHGPAVPLVSVNTIARELGIASATVRQLKATDLDFPQPIPVDGITADVYDGDEATAYISQRRNATGGRMGRPREGDEELLTTGLRLIRDEATMSTTGAQDAQLQQAIDATGGMYVRGKAKILLDFMKRFDGYLGPVANRPELAAAVARAREIWQD